MKILETPQLQTQPGNKKEQKQNINFKGASDYISLGLRFLDTNQAWGANGVDVGSMVLPRTTVDTINRGPAAGLETGRREASGTINHSLIGVYGSLAALAFSLALNKTFNVRADKIFADNESFDIIGKYFHNNIQKNGRNGALEATLGDVLKNVTTTNNGQDISLSEHNVQVIKERMLKALASPDIDKDTIPASTRQYLVNYIIEATGSESDYKLKGFNKETTSNLSTFVENLYNISKTLTKENVIKEFEKAAKFSENEFIKSIKKLNNRRTIAGMAVASGIGMSIQPMNIYLTKKKTGSDGFVGVEGREKDKSFGFKLWKLAAAAVFGGGIVANLAMKKGGLLKNIQYKGLVPTINQFKFIYGLTIMSRFMVARDKDELRESVVKDVLGFFNWLVLGNFVAKGVVLAMDKEKSLLKNPKESSFFKKILKTRDEVLVEGLKKANISSVSKDGKALKFSEMLKLLPASETGKAVSRRLKILNLAQVAGYLYSGLVLGIGIPKLNIYMTNKSEAKRKARLAEKKALEAKQMPQLSQAGADASKLEFLQPDMNKFLNK